MTILTHHHVLAAAMKWRTSNTEANRSAAITILKDGMTRFSDALALGEELVLLHKESGDLDIAISLLRTLERRFKQIGEETLCRWGSVLRLRANISLASNAIGAAEVDLKEAEEYYARAFEEFGTHYPRINELTTRFARAGLARLLNDESKSANLLRTVEADAESMLADARIWSRLKPHDNVWAPASRGEACLLLEWWDNAEAAYTEAIRASGAEEFPRISMAKQVRETLIPAFQRLGREIKQRLAKPNEFFLIPQVPPQ